MTVNIVDSFDQLIIMNYVTDIFCYHFNEFNFMDKIKIKNNFINFLMIILINYLEDVILVINFMVWDNVIIIELNTLAYPFWK